MRLKELESLMQVTEIISKSERCKYIILKIRMHINKIGIIEVL